MSAALFMTDSSVVIDALGNKYFCVSDVFIVWQPPLKIKLQDHLWIQQFVPWLEISPG